MQVLSMRMIPDQLPGPITVMAALEKTGEMAEETTTEVLAAGAAKAGITIKLDLTALERENEAQIA